MKRNPYIIGLVAAAFVVVLSGLAAADDWSNSGATHEPGVSSEPGASSQPDMSQSETPTYQEQGPVETGAPPSEGLTPMEREDQLLPPDVGREENVDGINLRIGIDTGP